MISLTRLSGSAFALNSDLVERVDSTWKLGQNKPETARRAAAEAVGGGIGQELDALAQLMRVPPASD